jgi:hypothetical protein
METKQFNRAHEVRFVEASKAARYLRKHKSDFWQQEAMLEDWALGFGALGIAALGIWTLVQLYK